MLQIHCPYCLETRAEEEFSYAGEADIVRPEDPRGLSDEEWGNYLFRRKNERGPHRELWCHTAGCRRYFKATRDTVTCAVLETHAIGAQSRPGGGGDG
jgi:sarcosine oxidase subunit delta